MGIRGRLTEQIEYCRLWGVEMDVCWNTSYVVGFLRLHPRGWGVFSGSMQFAPICF